VVYIFLIEWAIKAISKKRRSYFRDH